MAKVKLFTYNLLDLSGASVSVTGTADSGYPESRLYDRSIDFYWKKTATETTTVQVDQGASGNLSVDVLIIDKHNFNGKAMQWQYSDNGSSWTSAVTDWTQGDNNQIVKTLDAAITHRYWKVVIASAANPQCSEVYISGGYEFQVRFDEPPEDGDIENVLWNRTLGGLERSTKLGDLIRGRSYSVFLTPANLTSWRTAISYLDEYSLPFYVKDHEDNYWLARFNNGVPRGQYITEEQQTKNFDLIEIL